VSRHDRPTENGMSWHRMAVETARIVAEYERRDREVPSERYSRSEPGARFIRDTQIAAVHHLLVKAGLVPLRDRRVLDVGCGHGDWLTEFEAWGARRDQLAGIDLIPERVREAQTRLGPLHSEGGFQASEGGDIRTGNATDLPWAESSFDLVLLSTVFSSILAEDMRHAVAAEVARVLKPAGTVLWYDFFVDNPWNRAVRGVRRREIARLFPGFSVRLRKETLAPPVARWLAPWARPLAALLDGSRLLSTHLLGLLVKPG
jgi:ubiquinone/menaquinone biosynthesis C-methylase UbiE